MRTRTPLLDGWRFHLGDPTAWHAGNGFGAHKFARSHLMKAGALGLATVGADLAHWRTVDLPHDFVSEGVYDPAASSDHGCLPGGPAWYQRTFTVADRLPGERISLAFDGLYRDATVWIDGWRVGHHASGYLGVRFDITDVLEDGDRHAVAVRVDASEHEGWWYEGGGIYRPVHLERHPARAIAHDGVWARCAGTVRRGEPATLLVDTELTTTDPLILRTELRDAAGLLIGAIETPACGAVAQRLTIASPRTWSPDDPYLHTLVSELRDGDTVIDRVTTSIGMRSVAMDAERGFLLNGEPLVLRGFCCHQDLAGVGVALTAPLHAWKLERLRWLGANAYRSAHHPPAPELLDAADRLGVIVMNEHRLPGFDAESIGLLRALVLRDRNRACVGLWSLFNEEGDLQGRESGRRLVERMVPVVDALDGTRPVTAAVNYTPDGPLGKALPVLGFNYQHREYDAWRAANPGRPALGSETGSTLATRGVHDAADSAWSGSLTWPLPIPHPPERRHARILADGSTFPFWGGTAWDCWRAVAERPWLGGTFVWTGFDYYGETIPLNSWPAISTNFGVLDLGGLPKDVAWYYRSAWHREPVVRLGGHWSWHGRDGRPVPVRVFHNGDEVELWCNGTLIETIPAGHEPPLRELPYAPGWIEARCRRAGDVVAIHRLATAGPPAALRIACERSALAADGLDAAVLHIAVVDAAGTAVPDAVPVVTVAVEGPLRLMGGHNGDPCDHAAPTAAVREAWAGWLTVVVRAGRTAGPATVTATSPGFACGRLALAIGERGVLPRIGEA